jgi:hypothetical protein
MSELSDKMIPLLKEYDLPNVLEALSWHLVGAVKIAQKAVTLSPEMRLALEYAEQKTFRAHEAIAKIVHEKG